MADAGGEVACGGFDSPLLGQLAELRAGRCGTEPSAEDGPAAWAAPSGLATAGPSGNADVPAPVRVAFQALDLMPEAMRSIGFDPAPRRGICGALPERAGCRAARPGRHRLRPVSGAGTPRPGMARDGVRDLAGRIVLGRRRGHVPRDDRSLAALPRG